MNRKFIALLVSLPVLIGLAGCATPPPPTGPPRPDLFPGEGMVTQRAVLTARGRQFALNGYLARSATGARRLIVTEMFGHVLADVLVKSDGTVHVMRSSPLLRPSWISRYVATDMQCIFGGAPEANCPVRVVGENHFAIERRWYKLDLRIVDTKPGPQPPDLFDETKKAAQ